MKSSSEIFRRVRLVACSMAMLSFAMLAGSCMTAREDEAPEKNPDDVRGYKFSHAKHIETGMDDCTVCHDTSAGTGRALSTPGHDLCSVCHEIPASNTVAPEDPAEQAKCMFCHTRPDYRVTPWQPRLGKELKWQHEAHVAAEIACTTCHEKLDTATAVPVPTKPFCMDCHQKKDPALNTCSVCHNEMSVDAIPRFRNGQRVAHDSPEVWKKIHGQESRVDPNYCSMCHDTKNRCDDCHSVMAPDNHTAGFKHRTHGMMATWDRNTCATCHEEQFCIKCHRESKPVSHRAGWGEGLNSHCVNCHYPPERSGCAVCHEHIEHDSAMASPHNLALFPPNCAQCHPGGLPHQAPHPVNSSVHCTECHR